MTVRRLGLLPAALLLATVSPRARGDEPAADPDLAAVPHEERRAGDDETKRYFLLGPREQAPPPAKGHPLLVVLPGGDGGPDFLPFVKRVHANALAKDWLVAELVSVKWTPEQQVVWPTSELKVPKMAFTTEEFVDAVVADAAKARKVDRKRVYALGWSSSGPALYVHALQPAPPKKGALAGYYVAMSVFRPAQLPALSGAKGKAFFLDHSPDDEVCPFADAKAAEAALAKAGARVKLVTYAGGHGWRGNPYARLREGVAWLDGR